MRLEQSDWKDGIPLQIRPPEHVPALSTDFKVSASVSGRVFVPPHISTINTLGTCIQQAGTYRGGDPPMERSDNNSHA
jgi:hypothetical protein